MNDGMNRNADRSMNGCMNKNADRSMNGCMNRNMGRNMNYNMNRNMGRNVNCNMNQNMTGNTNCNMNRNTNGRNMNGYQMRNNMAQNRQGCGCSNAKQDNCNNVHDCDIETAPVDRMAPGMAYVPWQKWEDIYCMEKALERGTIFEQLDKPFIGGRGK